jgi:rhodanese-related sulfurtransferase
MGEIIRAREKAVIALLAFSLVFGSKSLAETDFKTIDTVRLHSMIVDNAYRFEGGREKEFTIIDTRTKEEYNKAHIFSAISIPEKEFEKLTDLLPRDKSTLLVVYCNGMKSETSRTWLGKATAAGYRNILIYSEGFSIWKEQKMPIAPLKSEL